jgi:glycosyltransferase involved in cell wall biosynthesis
MVKVSALMITGKTPGHRRLAEFAVKCFHEQLYLGEKELVIINTAADAPWFDGQPEVVEYATEDSLTLGELRNVSMDVATGDLMLQWDDDDWHGPNRMSIQVLCHRPGHLTLLQRQLRLDITSGMHGLYDGAKCKTCMMGGIVGTMLYDKTTRRFRHLPKREDSRFSKPYRDGRINVIQNNDPRLYVRLYHGGNTWDKKHVMSGLQQTPDVYKEFIQCVYQTLTS